MSLNSGSQNRNFGGLPGDPQVSLQEKAMEDARLLVLKLEEEAMNQT
jgi:hypothetical protein